LFEDATEEKLEADTVYEDNVKDVEVDRDYHAADG